jgi:hypothetical protein
MRTYMVFALMLVSTAAAAGDLCWKSERAVDSPYVGLGFGREDGAVRMNVFCLSKNFGTGTNPVFRVSAGRLDSDGGSFVELQTYRATGGWGQDGLSLSFYGTDTSTPIGWPFTIVFDNPYVPDKATLQIQGKGAQEVRLERMKAVTRRTAKK